jgi:transcriptional regulator with XRE-family HTH domain
LADNIRAAREAARMSQKDAARAAGMQPGVYGRIERGEVDPQISSVMKIAAGLDVATADLMRGVS